MKGVWLLRHTVYAVVILVFMIGGFVRAELEECRDIYNNPVQEIEIVEGIFDIKEIEDKINNAFCPEKIVEGNPILEIWKYIIFRKLNTRTIKRPAKFGGDIELQSYGELEKSFKEGKLHPLDLKKETSVAINEILEPVREYFEKNKKAKELYEFVKNVKVTR